MPGITSLIRSVFSPRQLYAVIGQSAFEFISVGMNGKQLVLFSSNKNISSLREAIDELSIQLRTCQSYLGEPFLLLLDVPEAVIYAKHYSNTLPPDASETVELLQKDGSSVLATASYHTTQGHLFVLQAIRKTFYDELCQAIAETQLPVLGIGTIQTLGIDRFLESSVQSKQSEVIPFGSTRVHSHTDGQGGMVFWTSRGDDSQNNLLHALTGTENPPHEEVTAGKQAEKQAKPKVTLRAWLKSLENKGVSNRLLQKNPASLRLRLLTVAANSLRLLSVIFMATLAISSLVTLSLTLMDPGSDATLTKYEQNYNRVVSLSQLNNSIRSNIDANSSASETSQWVAPVVTIFCQQRFGSLYLRSLTANAISADSALVEADGLSRSERSIFDLKSYIEQSASSLNITLASMRPEIISDGQRVDTLQAFKLVVGSHAK